MNGTSYNEGKIQMLYLAYEIEHICDVALNLYYKSMPIQESSPDESRVFFFSACYNFRYMIIRFCAFRDAYMESVNKALPKGSAKAIKGLLKTVDVNSLFKIRNEVLAHHFSKQTNSGKKSVIDEMNKGAYSFGSGSPTEMKHIKEVVHQITLQVQSDNPLP